MRSLLKAQLPVSFSASIDSWPGGVALSNTAVNVQGFPLPFLLRSVTFGEMSGYKGGGKGGKSGGKKGKDAGGERQKNWACEECGNTDNCAWWTVCGRASCTGGKPDPKPPAESKWDTWNNWSPSGWVDYQPPQPPPDQLLRAARENLKAVAAIFPEGHNAIAEVALQVSKLEEAQKGAAVSTSEKLRCLLYTQKELENKQGSSDAEVNEAAKTVKAATAALRVSLASREKVQRELAANQLEVAALTRDVTTPEGSQPIDIVQSLRARVDVLSDDDFEDGGFAKAELGMFFRGFAKLTALIDHAEKRASEHAPSTEPPPTPVTAPATTGEVPDPAVHTATAMGRASWAEAQVTANGLDSEDDDADSDGDKHMDDGDAAATAALEEADTLLALPATWAPTLPSAAGSSG